MAKRIDINRTLNAVLYILNAMGGRCDMHKIFKILYFADQMHLSKYGRSITSDSYIAMRFGPVPSMTDDIFKAVRGDSFFSDSADGFRKLFHFVNKYIVEADQMPDLDYLSESDIECIDEYINICRDMNFNELTEYSHGVAWFSTNLDRKISVKDILREAGDTEEYADYVSQKLNAENAF